MANVVEVPREDGSIGYKIRWRQGGGRKGAGCSETFDDPRLAARFKTDVEYHDHQYPPNYVPHVGYVTAEQLAALQAAEAAAQAIDARRPFLAYAADYIDHLTGIEPKTRADYHRFVQNHMASFTPFAEADVADPDQLTARQVAEWVNWLEAGVKDPGDEAGLRWLRAPKSPKTIANLHGLLYSIMQSAVVGERPIRKYNPCVGTRLPSLDDATSEEMVFLTPSEFQLLHAAADPTVRDVLLALVGTGMRWSEISAQQAGDYNAAAAQTRVLRAWKRQANNRYELGAPKTRAGRRRVVLDELTDGVFARAAAGRDADAYTFTTRMGMPLRHNNFFCRYWQRSVYRAVRCPEHRGQDRDEGFLIDGRRVPLTNLKSLRQRHLEPCGCPGTLTKVPRVHDLRHTHVAWQIAGNVPLSAIARRVGHENVQTTDRTYGHLLPELDTRQADAVYSALASAGFTLAA